MANTFNPSALRRASQGGEAFYELLPRAYTEFLDLINWRGDRILRVGKGVTALGEVATRLLTIMPEELEAMIVHQFSEDNGLFAPYSKDELPLPGANKRSKNKNEFTTEELQSWDRFVSGIDPLHEVSRKTTVLGLLSLYHGVEDQLAPISRYSAEEGEELLFHRVRDVIRATPYALTDVLLPDRRPEDLQSILYLKGDDSEAIFQAQLETARSPLIGE